MKTVKICKRIFWLMITIIAVALLSIRGSVISQYDWKHTAGVEYEADFFFFTGESDYKYQYPLIKKNDTAIGIAIFQFNGRLMVYSIANKSMAFFMKI